MERRDFHFPLVVLLALVSSSAQGAPILEVCSTCAYRTIHAAIEAAPIGATVKIGAGEYREGPLVVTRSLTLEPLDPATPPILDGQGKDEILKIKAPNVTVRGLHFRSSGYRSTLDLAAIRIENVEGCLVSDNEIENAAFGIYLAKVKRCTILHNRIHSTGRDTSDTGSGIHIWSAEAIEIISNEISGHRDGIYFEFVEESRIIDNHSHDNQRYGLHFMFSHGDLYQGNRFVNNESGVAVMYSRRMTMLANRFERSHGPAAYGLLLKDITDSAIQGNLFGDNTTGMYIEDGSRVRIIENDFERNGWAVRLIGSSEKNQFEHNNFLANTFEVAALPGSARNRFDSNYWSQYEGLDLNHDGFGDIPYHPVRLSAIWMQGVEGASFLMGSLFMVFVDRAEALLPAITPETVIDARPLIQRRP